MCNRANLGKGRQVFEDLLECLGIPLSAIGCQLEARVDEDTNIVHLEYQDQDGIFAGMLWGHDAVVGGKSLVFSDLLLLRSNNKWSYQHTGSGGLKVGQVMKMIASPQVVTGIAILQHLRRHLPEASLVPTKNDDTLYLVTCLSIAL